jgi:hypothetical protein
MVAGNFDQNDGRKPRQNIQSEESDSDGDIVDDDDVIRSEDEDSDEEELEIPDDPAHLARMAILRSEHDALQEQFERRSQEWIVVSGKAARMEECLTAIRGVINRVKTRGEEEKKKATGADGGGGCKPQRDFNPGEGRDDEGDKDCGTGLSKTSNA